MAKGESRRRRKCKGNRDYFEALFAKLVQRIRLLMTESDGL